LLLLDFGGGGKKERERENWENKKQGKLSGKRKPNGKETTAKLAHRKLQPN
jgi:hypothetical protein